jgi:hypothetical protein
MIGPRIGPRVGPIVGPKVGSDSDLNVAQENGLYFPESSSDWTALGLTAPTFAVDCNGVASGNLTDYIGGLVFTASGSPQYDQTATGFTRTGVGFTDNATMRFSMGAGVGPDPATTSSLLVIRHYLRTEPTLQPVQRPGPACLWPDRRYQPAQHRLRRVEHVGCVRSRCRLPLRCAEVRPG